MSAREQDMSRQEDHGQPRSRQHWRKLARIRQHIIKRQDKTIEALTASVVQLENDYDLVETELKSLLSTPNFTAPLKTSRPW